MTSVRPSLGRRAVAEGMGTAFLLAIVVGSGIMAERLAQGNVALALLANALATGTGLVVLITILGPISGAHLNPIVTLVDAIQSRTGAVVTLGYVAAQLVGAVSGVIVAHAMFGLPLLQASTTARVGHGQWLSEAVATFGLLLTIQGGSRTPDRLPTLVGLYVTSAYWFTASTAFANPAVTFARTMTETFAGIRLTDAPGFVVAQFVGAALAAALWPWLANPSRMAEDAE